MPAVATTQVAIIGAGPAGLLLAQLLHLQGIDSVILEQRSEAYVLGRVRAGLLESPTVEVLREAGVADRMAVEGVEHHGIHLRFDGRTHQLDFAGTTGRQAMNYGQAEVVKDLIRHRRATGRPLVFEAEAVTPTGFESLDGHGPAVVTWRDEHGEHRLTADFIAGCDGFHGVSRVAIPPGTITAAQRSYPFAWLGILARTRPTLPEVVYSAHQDGLSVHSMRGHELTRQYLQVPADTVLDDWPDERIWTELTRRHAADDVGPLATGEVIDRTLAPLRSVVFSPMQYGRMFLAGDAVHIVPPTGAKGLNLAVSDVSVLSHALGGYYAGAGSHHLAEYTRTSLPRIWQAELFSWQMTTMLHRFPGDEFDRGLQRARLEQVVASPTQIAALGELYFGLPFPRHWSFRD
ncbi:4-hydroxybenzoate 3-monooxygenase [Nakamurella leprariae]